MSLLLFSQYTLRQIEAMPLQVLHALLARLERQIEEALSDYVETTTMPGEGYRAKWESVREPEHVRDIYPIDQTTRSQYEWLATLCRRREAEEIERLRREFRQSDDPAVAKLIGEAIALERSMT